MKKALSILTIIGSSFLCSPIFSQEKEIPDSLGLPGDNLNLYGVLDVFQKSKTLEEFEKALNAEDSKVNNLDLNGNDKIDYISVIDNVQGGAHAIVLQVAVSEKENQDVAVIEVEKNKDGKVHIQIIGDEKLYGKKYIVEPKEASAETPNPGYSGSGDKKSTTTTNTTNNYYNSTNDGYDVRGWNIVHYMYVPTYVVYVSPWRWGYYPGYWNPWAPLYWHSYYGYHHHHHYNGYYHRVDTYRNPTAHNYYGPRRMTSETVSQRRESGAYNSTYGRRDLMIKPSGDNGRREQSPSRSVHEKPRNEVAPRKNIIHEKNNPSGDNGRREQSPSRSVHEKPRNEVAPRNNIMHEKNNPSGDNGRREQSPSRSVHEKPRNEVAPRNNTMREKNNSERNNTIRKKENQPRNINKINRDPKNNKPAVRPNNSQHQKVNPAPHNVPAPRAAPRSNNNRNGGGKGR